MFSHICNSRKSKLIYSDGKYISSCLRLTFGELLEKRHKGSFWDRWSILRLDCEIVTRCIHFSNSINCALKMKAFYCMYITPPKKILLLKSLTEEGN